MVEMYLKEERSSYEVSEVFGISRKTFFKWLKRYREYGREGLINKKAGAKKNKRKKTSSIEELIVKLRLDTPFGPERITYELRMRGISISPHGVYNVLKRRNLRKLPTFKEEKEVMRYGNKKPFEMVHIDVKYVGNQKGQGRVYQFTAIDDATRIVYAKLYKKKSASNSLSFLRHVMELSGFRIQSILRE